MNLKQKVYCWMSFWMFLPDKPSHQESESLFQDTTEQWSEVSNKTFGRLIDHNFQGLKLICQIVRHYNYNIIVICKQISDSIIILLLKCVYYHKNNFIILIIFHQCYNTSILGGKRWFC